MQRPHPTIGGASPATSFSQAMRSLREKRSPASRMRRFLGVVAACALSCLLPERAEAASYDGFDYPVGTPYASLTGGTNFTPFSTFTSTVAPGSLPDPTGTLLTSGNRLEGRTGSSGSAAILGYAVAPVARVGDEFWVSFLMRQDVTSSGLMTGMYVGGGSGRYFIGDPLSGPGNGTLVISPGGGENYVSSGVPFEGNRDYFVVAHFQRGPGNDLATLYVNPVPGTEPPASGVTFDGVDLVGSLVSFTFVVFTPSDVTASLDELRVGSSYADVAPVVPEPTTAFALMALATLMLRRRRPAN